MIYAGLSRILLEQIMSTSLSSAVCALDTDDLDKDARIVMKKSLNESIKKAGVTLSHTDALVDLYVDAFGKKPSRARIRSTGDRCKWIMGCPGVEVSALQGTRFEQFGELEDDHVFPASRRGQFTDVGLGQKLCRYHNIFWKGQHIAFALDDFWLS